VHAKAFSSLRTLRLPAFLVLLVVIWAGVQASGWTPAGWGNPLSSSDPPGLAVLRGHPIALEPGQTLYGIMRLLTYIAVFILAASLSGRSRDARALLGVIVCSAVLYTLYAMIADVVNRLSPTSGVGLRTVAGPDFSGPFINRNHYATYASLAALAAITLGLPAPRPGSVDESFAQRLRRRIGAVSGRNGFWIAAAIILIAGVMLSGSRGGWLSLTLGLMTAVAMYTRGASRLGYVLATALILAVTVFTLPGGEKLIDRTAMQLEQEGDEGRLMLLSIGLQAMSARPLLGWGMGSFPSTYYVFQPAARLEYFPEAHNTYLELILDLGVPAASLLFVAVLFIAVRCLVGFSVRARDRELPGLGLLACVVGGVHSLFDFGLQIAAVACVFATILGVAWAQSKSTRAVGNDI
jgi:O-antigen ligase